MPFELDTPDELKYNFFPVGNGSVNFMVRANNDAHVCLTAGPEETEPIIEVFLGGWGNTKSVIRRNRTKPEKAEADTPQILTAGEFRAFWIKWTDGVITVGHVGGAAAFLSWSDPEPFHITHVGVCTGWGAAGSWKIEGGPEFQTPDKLQYNFHAIDFGSFDVDFKGPSNCHIALLSSKSEEKPLCELILGGWENQASVIRVNCCKPDKVRVETPNLLSSGKFTTFNVSWNRGYLCVRQGGAHGPVLIDGKDCVNYTVRYLGVRTAWGSTGSWKIRVGGLPSGKEPGTAAPYVQSSAGGGGGGGVPCWLPAQGGNVPADAVAAGQDGEQLFVARARHDGALIPGKLVPSHGCAYVSCGGGEHAHQDYEVLCGCSGTWVPVTGSSIPPNAVPAGENSDGEPLFVGRANHEGTLTPGKVQESHGVCYIPYGGEELAFQEYEIFCSN